MAKLKNKSSKLITYKLSDFFTKKIELVDDNLLFGDNITIKDFINATQIKDNEVFKFFKIRKPSKEDFDRILSQEEIAELALQNNFNFEHIDTITSLNVVPKINQLVKDTTFYKESELDKRPPIITVMGHVDHGKTTLLDFVKKTNVVSTEEGGITQRIGAYTIKLDDNKITFIDTPGHEAFTQMRANGSQVTDIAIIVVAADDIIMPQTKESIDHAKAANVPIIIAINKIDKPNADVERIKNQLSDYGVMPEEWGGSVPFVEISALNGDGVDKLLETLLLQAEILNLTASYNIIGNGTIIESNIDKKRGNMISIIVNDGVVKVGDYIIIGSEIVKIKAMLDSSLTSIKEAYPSDSIELFGLGFSPNAGEKFSVIADLKDGKKVANEIVAFDKNEMSKPKAFSFDDIFKNINEETGKVVVPIILKAKSQGSLEALKGELEKIDKPHGKIEIIRYDVGEITNTDISLAEASKALIYTFDLPSKISSQNVKIVNHNIIYKIIEELENIVDGHKEPEFEEEKIGEIEVLKIFESSKFGRILGSQVKDGKVTINSKVKMIDHKDNVLFESDVKSLKIERNNVREVKKGKEFGLTLEAENDIPENATLLVYEMVEINE